MRAVLAAARRDAIGAKIQVRVGEQVFVREVNPYSSYLCSNDVRVHFGLGSVDHYDAVEVVWPTATADREVFPGGAADQFLTLNQGSGSSQDDGIKK